MKVYIAAPWVHRAYAKEVAEIIRHDGHEVTSRWHDEWGLMPDDFVRTEDETREEAEKDVEDVQKSDAVLVLNIEKSEGKAVEQGIAIDRHIPVIVVGERTHVFHWLKGVTMKQTLSEARWHLGIRIGSPSASMSSR